MAGRHGSGNGSITADAKSCWLRDQCAFITEVLRDPQTGRRFDLYPAQREFFAEAFSLNANGRLRYHDLIYSAPKKSRKTQSSAMARLYVFVVLSATQKFYCLANSQDQAESRVFQAVCRTI